MKLLLACLASLFCSVSVIAQEKPVSPEQAKLDALIGHWTIEGSKHTYLEICNRIQGNHIQCMSTSKENGKTDSSVSYLSYAAAEKMYVYYGLYSSGNSRTLKGRWESDHFIFDGQRVTTEKTTRWRVTITPADKNIHFVEETSVNNGAWEVRADFVYVRLR